MAVAFESSNTTYATGGSYTSITLTKPSGLEEGDLLLAYGYGDDAVGAFQGPSGWTFLANGGDGCSASEVMGLSWVAVKIATASDVAASNFAFTYHDDCTFATADSATDHRAYIWRVTGHTGDLSDILVDSVQGPGNETTISLSTNLDPIRPGAGLLMTTFCGDSTQIGTTSNYQITSAGSNPTWTEDYDDVYVGDERSYSAARAVYTDNDVITAFGFDYTNAGTNGQRGLLVVIRAQNPVPDPVPVVESVSSTSRFDGSGSTITVTKPTGVTAGDLLLTFHTFYETGSNQSITTLSGWTLIDSYNAQFVTVAAYYRIADASDVSASNYTWSSSGGSDEWSIGMMRISGVAPASTIQASEIDGQTSATTSFTHTTAVTPANQNSLIVFYAGAADTTILGSAITTSSYTSTPSYTWTEHIDVGHKDGAANGTSLAVATATNGANTTEITSRGATYSETSGRASASGIIIINTPNAYYGSASLLEPTVTLRSPAGEAGTSGTQALKNVSPTFPAQSGVGESPTQWTQESAPNTTWTQL